MQAGPRYLVGWDTEDDSNGTPLLFAFVHEKGHYVTQDADAALDFLAFTAREQRGHGRTVEAWATNLEYDLVNLFGRERLRELFFQFGRSHLCGARWKRVEFRDTLRHVPASVAELGRIIGLEKLEGNLFNKRQRNKSIRMSARLLTRATRDATITYRAAKLIGETYAEFDDRPRLTLPATAYKIWLASFWKRPVYPVVEEIRESAGRAYFGGRTEAFALGTFKGVRVIDASSMFPWAMTAGPFPVPWGAFRRVRAGAPVAPGGLYRARVESDLAIPVLPFRSKAGNVFPVGKWTGDYVGEELLLHAELGGKVRVLSGFEFLESARPFDGYIAEMFHRKQSARGPMRNVYKLLLNSLYGKFGQQGGRVRACSLEKFAKLKVRPIDYRIWNGIAIWQQETPAPPWGNNIWAAIITARARVRLYREFMALRKKGARILYCDTDSAIYEGPSADYPLKAKAPGDFEARGKYRSVLIVGKKEYGLEDEKGAWDVHVKGVPFAERRKYLETGKAEFQRPTRLREAARKGLQANLWRDHTKERHVNYSNRRRSRDGGLLPPEIQE